MGNHVSNGEEFQLCLSGIMKPELLIGEVSGYGPYLFYSSGHTKITIK